MSVQVENRVRPSLSDRLGDALRKANEGDYGRAIEIIEEISAVDSRNTYMIAFHCQIQKLKTLDQDRSPSSQDQRREILLTIPAIFEHAVENAREREREGSVLLPSPGSREKALEEVKKTYLRRADEFMERGDYEHALAEIRRANIVHPNDVDVQHYENRIEQIVALQHPPTGELTPSEPPQPGRDPHHADAVAPVLIEPLPAEIPATPAASSPAVHPKVLQTPPKFWLAAATLALLLVAGSLYLHLAGGNESPVSTPVEQKSVGDEANAVDGARPSDRSETSGVPLENISITPPVVVAPRPTPPRQEAQSEEPVRKAVVPEVRRSQPTGAMDFTKKPDVRDPLFSSQRLPSLVRFSSPAYPDVAKSLGLEGSVKLRVKIGTDGKPLQVRVIESSNPIFNDPAIEAIMKSQFSPGMMPSGPVSSWVTIPVVFRKN